MDRIQRNQNMVLLLHELLQTKVANDHGFGLLLRMWLQTIQQPKGLKNQMRILVLKAFLFCLKLLDRWVRNKFQNSTHEPRINGIDKENHSGKMDLFRLWMFVDVGFRHSGNYWKSFFDPKVENFEFYSNWNFNSFTKCSLFTFHLQINFGEIPILVLEKITHQTFAEMQNQNCNLEWKEWQYNLF